MFTSGVVFAIVSVSLFAPPHKLLDCPDFALIPHSENDISKPEMKSNSS